MTKSLVVQGSIVKYDEVYEGGWQGMMKLMRYDEAWCASMK